MNDWLDGVYGTQFKFCVQLWKYPEIEVMVAGQMGKALQAVRLEVENLIVLVVGFSVGWNTKLKVDFKITGEMLSEIREECWSMVLRRCRETQRSRQ
jgi:ABC-type thiamin/hydroxymethylpyrimidine transport system permease subunit